MKLKLTYSQKEKTTETKVLRLMENISPIFILHNYLQKQVAQQRARTFPLKELVLL